ncbi:MAG: DUF2207 domain-containing protein [Clostridia bacterium]
MLKSNFKFNLLIRIIFCIFIMMFFILINQVSANSIKSIDMDVYIDNNGNATVTEVWNANLTEGTEGYRPYTRMGNSEISNFSVTDQTGTTYQSLSTWNTSASFKSKAYKNGINTISNGVELCWGISNYGDNTYTLKYNISNFITQYTDTQGIYFNFLDLDQRVSNAKITIHSNHKFSLDNARIWAFGNDGTINFVDGKIVLNSKGKLSSSQYMVALVRFESNIFNTTNASSKSFDDVYDSAMSSVSNDSFDGLSLYCGICGIIVFGYLIFTILLFACYKKKYNSNRDSVEYRPLDLGPKIKKQEVTYFRDIPCNGDLYYAYWIMLKYKILKEDECKNGLVGAILLKWIKEGYIELSKTRGGLFNLQDNKYAITFKSINTEFFAKNETEKYLMRIFRQASGNNNILEAKEFEKWCRSNHHTMNRWFDMLISDTEIQLQQKGLILEDITTSKKLWKTKTIITKYVDGSVRDEALNLLGLKKFLLDYSLIPDRENIQVHILEDYLVFAQLLGIADKVEEQFSKLYPDFKEISKINVENTSLYTKTLSVSMVSALARETLRYERRTEREARRRARKMDREYSHSYSGSDRDSGGGGSSYSSGGSSSGGSSGGGFR